MDINIKIPEGANKIIHTLQEHGYSAYIVGGCVRDSILGRIPNDWDICTSATPYEMMNIFKDERIIETGLQHGTITILINNEGYEVTTYRIDGNYSDKRRPDTITFTNDLTQDLSRRDFTINAMAYNDIDGLIDPFGGVYDINHKLIRCVGSPRTRFNEDALRILRAIRFASQLDFSIESNTIEEIFKQSQWLRHISIERINSEFCKIISAKNCSNKLLEFSNVFSIFIPEIADMFCFKQNNPYHSFTVYGHTVHAMKMCDSDDLIVRLAVFFHDIGKPYSFQDDENGIRHFKCHGKVSADITNRTMKNMRFDNDTREKVVQLVFYHDATFDNSKKSIKRWLNKIGEEQFRRLLKVRKSDIKGQKIDYDEDRISAINLIEKNIDDIINEKECFSLKQLAVNGDDLINIGYKPGKDIGIALQKLLQDVINGEITNEKEILLNHANNIKILIEIRKEVQEVVENGKYVFT